MLRKSTGKRTRITSKYFVISGLALALCLGGAAAWAQQGQPGQDQPGDVSAAPMPQDQQAPQEQAAPDQAMPPQAPPSQGGPEQGMPPEPPNRALPQTLTIPAGTVIRVRVNEWLSSDRNLPGDTFAATLDQPIVVDGWVVARRGQSETGRVSMAIKAKGGNGKSQLGVDLLGLTLVDGQQVSIQTQLQQSSTGPSNGRNAAVIGTTAGVGAAVGAAAGGGPGAALGAVIGGAAGIVGVFSTPGRPTMIPPETVLSFQLQGPVSVSTVKSQSAFQSVTQGDYDSRTANGRFQRFGNPAPAPEGYPPPAPYYSYGYPYAYAYPYPYAYYPAPFAFGFYGGYGFGPRWGYRGGFRR